MPEYHYAGPDGGGISGLPPGAGAALGSEYCVHLLPGADGIRKACAAARERNAPLILLTPYFRDAELKRTVSLFRAIPADADVVIAVNDWGALFALRGLFPGLRLTVGRLLSGQKKCPRIKGSPHLTETGRSWHGEGIFASRRAREYLRDAFGVRGYHADLLPWGRPPYEQAPDGDEHLSLYVHGPYALVTVSDSCPWIGGRSSAAVSSCTRPCLSGCLALREPSMGERMIQKGKARFLAISAPACRETGLPPRVSPVLYGEPP